MLSLQAVVLCLAATGAGDAVLIDFSASWCGPCRQMDPVVQRLASMGYAVRKVDIDQQRDLASQFKVRGVPCFVMVVGGQEVDRVVGATSFERLQQMFARHSPAASHSPRPPVQARGQSPDVPAQNAAATTAANPALDAQLLSACVRLKIDDATGHSYGSGTIIDVRGQEAVVLTCGHIFRDSKGQGRISVDLFGSGAPQGLPGRLIAYDLESDVGLVSFHSTCNLNPARVAPAGFRPKPGDAVINIGCNNGGDPTVRHSRVTSIDKFLGPANLQVAGQPVVGRSGGGLFSAHGLVIGVCNAADPTDNEGLYAALPSIWALLDKQGLAALYQRRESAVARGPAQAPASGALADRDVPNLPQQMPVAMVDAPLSDFSRSRLPGGASSHAAVATHEAAGQSDRAGRTAPGLSRQSGPAGSRFTAPEQAALAQIQSRGGAEVICIVRPNDPQGKSEVVVLDKASHEFLRHLAAERSNQEARHLTSLQVDRPAAGLPASPQITTAAARPTTIPSPPWQPKWNKPR
jgi:thiol-disulfide isomerase/thioredoxin